MYTYTHAHTHTHTHTHIHIEPDLFFPTPSTNLSRELRESPQSPQERCATVSTSCAQRQEIIFTCEFVISSQYQVVEETEIYVGALFGYLGKENR